MNKLLVSGILIFVSIVAFYTFSKEATIHSTNKKNIVNNFSTSELRYQEKKIATKIPEISFHKAPLKLIQLRKKNKLDWKMIKNSWIKIN